MSKSQMKAILTIETKPGRNVGVQNGPSQYAYIITGTYEGIHAKAKGILTRHKREIDNYIIVYDDHDNAITQIETKM